MYFTAVKYTATQTSQTSFTVSLADGFSALAPNVEAVLMIRDASGKYASVNGYLAGTTLNINWVYESSSANNTMPSFGTGIEVFSDSAASILSDGVGMGGILLIGQSNGMGTEENTRDAIIDYEDSRILEWKENEGYDHITTAIDPLGHPDPIIQTGAVGLAITFAKDIIAREKHNKICLLPHCEGSTGFAEGQWVKGGARYNGALALANKFLADNPNNYLIAMVWSLGEDDAYLTGRATAFEAKFDQATNDLRADLVGNDRQSDFSRLPVLCTGMSQDWIPNYPTSAPIVQTALEEIGGRIPYSAYVSSVGLTTQLELSNIHFDTPGYRELGSRCYAALKVARGNTTAGIDSASLIGTATISATLRPSEITATANLAASATITASTESFTEGQAALSATATINAIPSSVPSVTLTAEYLKGTGITGEGTALMTWADQTVNGNDATQTVVGAQPAEQVGGELLFDGVDDGFSIPAALLNNAQGWSIMVQATATGDGTFVGSNKDAFYVGANHARGFSETTANLAEGTTNIATGTLHKVYVTCNGTNNQMTVYVDGVLEKIGPVTGTFPTNSANVKIGLYNGSSLPFAGTIHNLAIADGVLSLADMNSATSGW